MARIRTIKPEFWADEKLGPLRPIDRLVFLGIVSNADDAGRVLDSHRLLNGTIFPYTDDDCVGSLSALADLGVIERGVTTSGQAVIQVVGWERHQKIDKPNLRAALQPIAILSSPRRRKIPDRVRAAIYERDESVCQACGIAVKIGKDDKYDNDPTLAEIDHIIAVADGGTNDPQNLQLLCLSCNRKKAGDAVRRRVGEGSAKDRRGVENDSRPDLRPTTYDLVPTTVSTADDERTFFGSLSDVTVTAIKGLYGWDDREGTEESLVWNGEAPDERKRCLRIAIQRYEAADQPRFYPPFFRSILKKVVDEQHTTANPWGPLDG